VNHFGPPENVLSGILEIFPVSHSARGLAKKKANTGLTVHAVKLKLDAAIHTNEYSSTMP